MTSMPAAPCPSVMTLSAWLDDEMGAAEAKTIRSHIEQCASCREQVAGWVHTVRELAVPSVRNAEVAEGCLDAEMLVAYSEAELSEADSASAERHLQGCLHCLSEVQRLVQLRVALGDRPVVTTAALDPQPDSVREDTRSFPVSLTEVATAWVGHVGAWMRSVGRLVAQPWPALAAVAATAIVTIVIARGFVSQPGDVQFRGVPVAPDVQVVADSVTARARPADDGQLATRL